MNIIYEVNAKPIFSWCPNAEQGALDQITKIATLPYVEHIALMPDAHQGMECPIGSVIATNSVIVPSFVGVDIGCGVACFKTNITLDELKGKEEILYHSVSRSIPMGFSHNTDKRRNTMKAKYEQKIQWQYRNNKLCGSLHQFGKGTELIFNENDCVKESDFYEQMGTLGGGNHFIEVSYDEAGKIWIMVHSGSRNIGKRVCDRFNAIAKIENAEWYSKSDIPFLPVTSDEGKHYINWMNIALNFAYYNRQAMLDDIWHDFSHYFPNAVREEDINIHHNYASLENHFGKNLWVHRKGATLASDKTTGIIPGSMATGSYIVKGLGNPKSLNSCSHGSGRRMGRMAFNQSHNTEEALKEIKASMEGITYTKFGKATSRKGKDLGMLDLSEAPQAYKDIEDIMIQQADLVAPIYRLKPVINWKDVGDE